jgi:cytochrome c heme-lyase
MHASSSPPSAFPPLPDSLSTQTPPPSRPVKSSNNPLLSLQSSSDSSSTTISKLNPLNYIPANLPNTRSSSSPQTLTLPLSRSTSSIPRADTPNTKWEYPSPQQMYNAMLRKGYTDTPADAVESMVAVHNFLNEGAWEEIVEWEGIFRGGLKDGWRMCKMGKEGMRMERLRDEVRTARREELGLQRHTAEDGEDEYQPQLVRFQGRPKDMTPKAGILQALGWVWPTKFGYVSPFLLIHSKSHSH